MSRAHGGLEEDVMRSNLCFVQVFSLFKHAARAALRSAAGLRSGRSQRQTGAVGGGCRANAQKLLHLFGATFRALGSFTAANQHFGLFVAFFALVFVEWHILNRVKRVWGTEHLLGR